MKPAHKGKIFTQVVLEIFKVEGMLNNEGDRLSKEFGLTSSRWKILGAVSMSESLLTVPQIARTMGQSRQAVQRLVDVMSKDDLLKQVENPNHKRAKYIELTPKAEKLYNKLDKKQVLWAEQCSSGITKSELETTLNVLNKLSSQFDS
jgi:DNA-binding MarR family transcriptional regulator